MFVNQVSITQPHSLSLAHGHVTHSTHSLSLAHGHVTHSIKQSVNNSKNLGEPNIVSAQGQFPTKAEPLMLLYTLPYIDLKNWGVISYIIAITFDFVRVFPLLSNTATPSMSSRCRITGILMQLAAAVATQGTHR